MKTRRNRKDREERKARPLTADEAKGGKNTPDPGPAVEAVVEEKKAATPEHKRRTEARLHWVPEGGDRSLCGIFALDPRMITADAKEDVTCAVCLKALSATGGKKREKAERVTIQCADCGCSREIFASQVGIVTRCEICQKRYRRRKNAQKRKAKMTARRKERRAALRLQVDHRIGEASALLMGFEGDKAMLIAIKQVATGLIRRIGK